MKPITDIDGRDIPPPEPTSDLAAFERIVMFCRRNHIRIVPTVPMRIGNIVVAVEDMDLPRPVGAPDSDLAALSLIRGYGT
jgi:hypothetical protein